MIYLSLNPSPKREGLLTSDKIEAPLGVWWLIILTNIFYSSTKVNDM
jgi:hypothetical protein